MIIGLNHFKLFKIFLVFAILSNPLWVEGQEVKETGRPFISNYAPKLYDANPQNWSITQDHRGVMYFGNSDGILEYDGVNWRLIKTPKNNVVRSLDCDENGRIWVGGSGEIGYLEPDSVGKMTFHSLTNYISSPFQNFQDIWFTKSVKGEGVFFGGFRRSFKWTGEEMIVEDLDSTKAWGQLYVNDNRYLYRFDTGVFVANGKDMRFLNGTEILGTRRLAWIDAFTDDEILLVTRTGEFYTHDGNTLKPLQLESHEEIKKKSLNQTNYKTAGRPVCPWHPPGWCYDCQ